MTLFIERLKIVIFFICSILLIFGLEVNTVKACDGGIDGNGVLACEKRSIAYFNCIEICGAFEVIVDLKKDYGIELTADSNVLPIIDTVVMEGVLRIAPNNSYCTQKIVKLYISLPHIMMLKTSGSSQIIMRPIDNESMAIISNGAASINAFGVTNDLILDITGGSNLFAKELKARNVIISIVGAGNAQVYAINRLDVNVTGVGNIQYYGNPKISKKILGIGDIQKGD